MKKTGTSEKKSKGAIIAEKARARGNGYSDEKRAILIEEGMALISGGSAPAKCSSHRR